MNSREIGRYLYNYAKLIEIEAMRLEVLHERDDDISELHHQADKVNQMATELYEAKAELKLYD